MAALSVIYSNFCGMVVSETRSGVESDYVSGTLGSTIGLMGSTGTLTDRWEYWPYGEVVSRTGTSATPLTFLGVLGYFQDVLSKLLYVSARHLRVDLARWLTLDPLWPAQKAFGYVANMPTEIADPSGLSWGIFIPCWAALVSTAFCITFCIYSREIVCECWAFIDVFGTVVYKCMCCPYVIVRRPL
jgi:RHS repeat-associated protein